MNAADPEPRPTTMRLRIPLARPWVTYALLAVIGVAFVAQTVLGGSTDTATLIRLGAQVNPAVAEGELWRLLAAMFLHIGLQHIGFNGWALFSVGREVESFYGPLRFALLYFISGLAGNLAYYWLGDDVLSAGASGAVFGIIGAEAAYFLLNRKLFGAVGRQRLGNLAILIGINLVFGFTVKGINNLAHLGGLIFGLLLGLGLAPRYTVERGDLMLGVPPRVRTVRSLPLQIAAVAVALLLLAGALRLGHDRWQGSVELLRSRAAVQYEAGDLAGAQRLYEQALSADPDDLFSLFNAGVVYLQTDQPAKAVTVLERAYRLRGEDSDTLFALGVAYALDRRMAEARPVLESFLRLEPTGERADYVRSLFAAAP